jgi:ornithine decarboxylase
MEHYDHYPILLAEHELGSGSANGRAAEAIEAALVRRGLEVITATTLADVEFILASNASVGAVLLDWDLVGSPRELKSVVERAHSLSEQLPVLLLAERSDIESFPLEVAELTDGAFWLHEDTPEFVAGRVERLVTEYADNLLSPFFGALKRYVDNYNWVWCCPGHNGGMFYRKTPLGRIFFDYVGEPFLRGDLCNASPELGSILQHQGPVLDAEQRAAEVFGAERTYKIRVKKRHTA